jgi:hypothetical protein
MENPEMNKFEYKVKRVSVSIWRGDQDLVNALADFGNEGWELVSTNFNWWSSQYDLFFKRRQSA